MMFLQNQFDLHQNDKLLIGDALRSFQTVVQRQGDDF